jgi:LssY C-terminus
VFTPVQADLAPGKTIDVRLNGAVYSDRSRTGDPIEGTVTYPLCKGGEQVACKPGDLVLPPGTRVNGTVLFSQKAPDKYSRPRLVLDFSNIVQTDGQHSPLYARVLSVDNARETVRNNEILGIIQPHASTKTSLAMAAVSVINPIAGYTIKGMQAVYGLSIRREILFPAGTDLQLQIVRPSMLKRKEAWPGWPAMTVDANLETLVTDAPLRTHTTSGTPSDITNLMFLGSRQQLESAFNEAGWFAADDLSIRSAAKTVAATIRQAGYSSAPVSLLRINGQPPNLVFQKSLNTFANRHHLRIWKLSGTYKGREVWIGAATHDIAISKDRSGTKWSHRIDPHIDRERDWVATDLLFAGTAVAYVDVDRPAAPKKAANATGDQILTDGKMSVLELGGSKAAKPLDAGHNLHQNPIPIDSGPRKGGKP